LLDALRSWIDKNVVRRNQTPAERADMTARRKSIDETDPETRAGAVGGLASGLSRSSQSHVRTHSTAAFVNEMAAGYSRVWRSQQDSNLQPAE
jgi:hypothetical protein